MMAMCYNFIRQKEASIYNMHPLSVVQIGCDNKNITKRVACARNRKQEKCRYLGVF